MFYFINSYYERERARHVLYEYSDLQIESVQWLMETLQLLELNILTLY